MLRRRSLRNAQESYGRGRRLLVDEHNKVKGVDAIYAIGDTSLQTTDKNFPEGHPQLAQVAIQQGKLLAKNLVAQQKQKPMKPFAYNDKEDPWPSFAGTKPYADLPKGLFFRGFIAWAMWLFIHLLSLINYRNRLKTLYNWTAAYFTRDQSLRMIIRPSRKE